MFKIETINPMFEDDIIDNDCIGNIKLRQYIKREHNDSGVIATRISTDVLRQYAGCYEERAV